MLLPKGEIGIQFLLDAINNNDLDSVAKFFKNNNGLATIIHTPVGDNKTGLLQYVLKKSKENNEFKEEIFKEILKVSDNLSMNYCDLNGDLPIFMAAEAGPNFINILKEFNKDDDRKVNWLVTDKNGNNLLAYLLEMPAENVNDNLLNAIIDKKVGLDIDKILNYQNNNGENLLHNAAKSGNPDNFTWCLDNINKDQLKKLLNSQDAHGYTPLDRFFNLKGKDKNYLKLKQRDIEFIVDEELYDITTPNQNGQSIISCAVRADDKDFIDYVKNKNDEKINQELIFSAIENGKVELLINDLLYNNVEKKKENVERFIQNSSKERLLNFARKIPNDKFDVLLDDNITADSKELNDKIICAAIEACNEALVEHLFDKIDVDVNNHEFVKSLASVKDNDNFGKVLNAIERKNPEKFLQLFNNTENRQSIFSYVADDPKKFSSVVERLQNLERATRLFNLLSEDMSVNTPLGKFLEIALPNEVQRIIYLDKFGLKDLAIDSEAERNILNDQIKKAAFNAARSGNKDLLKLFVEQENGLIYEEEKGKSLLEVAADNSHIGIVQYIMSEHKKKHKDFDRYEDIDNSNTPSYRFAEQLLKSSNSPVFVDELAFLNRGIKDALQLKEKLDNDSSDINSKIDDFCKSNVEFSTVTSPIDSDKLNTPDTKKASDKKSNEFQGYGKLFKYIHIIKSRSKENESFKKEVIEKLSSIIDIKEKGHNIISLVASYGTIDQWELINSKYEEVYKNKKMLPKDGTSASFNQGSDLGIPIQCAISSGNVSIFEHLLSSDDNFFTSKGYGDNKDNIFHTIANSKESNNLFQRILNEAEGRDATFFAKVKKPFAKTYGENITDALLQANKSGQTPIEIALKNGNNALFSRMANHIVNYSDINKLSSELKKLLNLSMANDNLYGFNKILQIQDVLNEKNQEKKGQLDLLNYESINGKDNWLSLAVGNNSKKIVKSLSLTLRSKYDKELGKDVKGDEKFKKDVIDLFVRKLPRDFHNKGIFDVLLNQCTGEAELDKKDIEGIINNSLENGNVRVAQYFSDMEPGLLPELIRKEYDKLLSSDHQSIEKDSLIYQTIKDENAELLNLAINYDNDNSFEKASNEFLSPLELSLLRPNLYNVCYRYLKKNPECIKNSQNKPLWLYRAIFSKDSNLLNEVIKEKDIVFEKYDGLNGKLPEQLKGDLLDENNNDIANVKWSNVFDYASYCNADKSIVKLLLQSAISQYPSSTMNQDVKQRMGVSLFKTLLEFDHGEVSEPTELGNINNIYQELSKTCLSRENLITKDFLYSVIQSNNKKLSKNFFGEVEQQVESGQLSKNIENAFISAISTDSSLFRVLHLFNDTENFKEFVSILEKLEENVSPKQRASDIYGLITNIARCGNEKLASEMFELVEKSDVLGEPIKEFSKEQWNEILEAALRGGNFEICESIQNRLLDYGNDKAIKPLDKRVQEKFDRSKVKLTSEERYNLLNLSEKIDNNKRKSDKRFLFDSEGEFVANQIRKTIFDQQSKLRSYINKEKISDDDRKEFSSLLKNCSIDALELHPLVKDRKLKDLSIIDFAFVKGDTGLIKDIVNFGKTFNPAIKDDAGNTLLHKMSLLIRENPNVVDRQFINNFSKLIKEDGFSVLEKNNKGQSALTIVQDLADDLPNVKGIKNIESIIKKWAEDEEIIRGEYSNVIDDFFAVGDFNSLENYTEKHFNYSKIVENPIHRCMENIFSDQSLINKDVLSSNIDDLKKLLHGNYTREFLLNTDDKGNNFLQRIVNDISVQGSDSRKIENLSLVFKEVLNLDDKSLIERLLFNHRNTDGSNTIEGLARLPGSYSIFKDLEKELQSREIASNCDLNLLLANAASGGNHHIFRHILKNYNVYGYIKSDKYYQSLLHLAVISGDKDTVFEVLSYGININRLDKDGNTALGKLMDHIVRNQHYNAVSPGHFDIVNLLVSRGASFTHKNKNGLSPLDMVKDIDYEKVVDKLFYSRNQYYELKKQTGNILNNCIERNKKEESHYSGNFDIGGNVLAVDVGRDTLKIDKLLKAGKGNNLNVVDFKCQNSDGSISHGRVQKIGNKKNYTVSEGEIKLTLEWMSIKPKKVSQKIIVYVNKDGSITCDYEYNEKFHTKQINFDNCQVYVGGIPLKDAMDRGKWRDRITDFGKIQEEGQGKTAAPFDGGDDRNSDRINQDDGRDDDLGEDSIEGSLSGEDVLRDRESDVQSIDSEVSDSSLDDERDREEELNEAMDELSSLLSEGSTEDKQVEKSNIENVTKDVVASMKELIDAMEVKDNLSKESASKNNFQSIDLGAGAGEGMEMQELRNFFTNAKRNQSSNQLKNFKNSLKKKEDVGNKKAEETEGIINIHNRSRSNNNNVSDALKEITNKSNDNLKRKVSEISQDMKDMKEIEGLPKQGENDPSNRQRKEQPTRSLRSSGR